MNRLRAAASSTLSPDDAMPAPSGPRHRQNAFLVAALGRVHQSINGSFGGLEGFLALAAETMTKTSSAAANEVRLAGPNCCGRADDAAGSLLGEPGLGPLEMCAE